MVRMWFMWGYSEELILFYDFFMIRMWFLCVH